MLHAAGPATRPPLGLVVLECALARAHNPRQLAEWAPPRSHDPARLLAPPRPPVAAGAGSGPAPQAQPRSLALAPPPVAAGGPQPHTLG
eukprot:6445087-Alexandrium_andersonii.AAC.1